MQQLNLLYYALLAGQTLFAAVVYFLISTGSAGEGQSQEMFRIAVPMLILSAAVAAFFLGQQRTNQAESLTNPEEKLAYYRITVIMRSALLEGANLFALVAALVEGNLTYFLYFLVGLLAFLYFRPNSNFT